MQKCSRYSGSFGVEVGRKKPRKDAETQRSAKVDFGIFPRTDAKRCTKVIEVTQRYGRMDFEYSTVSTSLDLRFEQMTDIEIRWLSVSDSYRNETSRMRRMEIECRIPTVSTWFDFAHQPSLDLRFEQMFGNGWIYGESSIGAVPLSLSPLVSLSLKQSDKGQMGAVVPRP